MYYKYVYMLDIRTYSVAAWEDLDSTTTIQLTSCTAISSSVLSIDANSGGGLVSSSISIYVCMCENTQW